LIKTLGPVTLDLIGLMTLKMVLGINLIGRRTFLLQKCHPHRNLTRQETDAEIMQFRDSNDRKRVMAVITSERMSAIDYTKKERMDQAMEVLEPHSWRPLVMSMHHSLVMSV
jgi:hypothetical protein